MFRVCDLEWPRVSFSHRVKQAAKIRVKNREPVPAYAMADADRDSDMGDDSPPVFRASVPASNPIWTSARSEGETSGDHSSESSNDGLRETPAQQTLQSQQSQQNHQPLQPPPPQLNISHHSVGHQQMNNLQISNQHHRKSPRPLERELKVRDDCESLKSSLHPHLSSLASLAQGAPISSSSSVFALASTGTNGGFSYAPPAFLAPAPPPPVQPVGSASSSSSEGSGAGWSFEEQYKQVRQLYELSDEPQRREFLDDLFSFMQRRGTPINRLPIMAKTVLDLYELYNLVVSRGGLVEVINKKLWQEIIKGLKLPSSITSAAFTLRTQYMKYLYEYECERRNLSTRQELDAAIEGNKREGRRSTGQQYEAVAQAAHAAHAAHAVQHPSLLNSSIGIPNSLAGNAFAQMSMHLATNMAGMIRLRQPPNGGTISQQELDYRLREYMKLLQNGGEPSSPVSSNEPNMLAGPSSAPTNVPFDLNLLNQAHFSRMAQWYSNQDTQREALNLSEPMPGSSNGVVRREREAPYPKRRPTSSTTISATDSNPTTSPVTSSSPRVASPRTSPNDVLSPSRPLMTSPRAHQNATPPANGFNGFPRINIVTRRDTTRGENFVVVTVELDGLVYEGILYPSDRC